MRQHTAVEAEWAGPHHVQRRADDPLGAGAAATVLLGLQRTAGNAAVSAQLGAAGAAAGAPAMAFVQRCGPTPCSCSAEERADYAEQHPDEPASPEAASEPGGHEHALP